MNKWISVIDQLPEMNKTGMSERCLVSCETKKGVKNINIAYYNGTWHGSGSMSGVKAWMPLPETYEEEERNE